jgi:hypothetical protein
MWLIAGIVAGPCTRTCRVCGSMERNGTRWRTLPNATDISQVILQLGALYPGIQGLRHDDTLCDSRLCVFNTWRVCGKSSDMKTGANPTARSCICVLLIPSCCTVLRKRRAELEELRAPTSREAVYQRDAQDRYRTSKAQFAALQRSISICGGTHLHGLHA